MLTAVSATLATLADVATTDYSHVNNCAALMAVGEPPTKIMRDRKKQKKLFAKIAKFDDTTTDVLDAAADMNSDSHPPIFSPHDPSKNKNKKKISKQDRATAPATTLEEDAGEVWNAEAGSNTKRIIVELDYSKNDGEPPPELAPAGPLLSQVFLVRRLHLYDISVCSFISKNHSTHVHPTCLSRFVALVA